MRAGRWAGKRREASVGRAGGQQGGGREGGQARGERQGSRQGLTRNTSPATPFPACMPSSALVNTTVALPLFGYFAFLLSVLILLIDSALATSLREEVTVFSGAATKPSAGATASMSESTAANRILSMCCCLVRQR